MNRFSSIFITSLAVMTVFMLSSCYGPASDVDSTIEEWSLLSSGKWIGDSINPKKDVIDPRGDLSREDYSELFEGKNIPDIADSLEREVSLPDALQIMSEPERPVIADDKLVSLMVTDDVPLKEVLIELARRADIDMEIDPGITGGIILSAKERPFSEVIDRVAKLANLRYSIRNNILRVERDTPVIMNYRMNLLNSVRTSSGSIDSPTSLGGGGDSDTGGSTSTLNTISENGDLWAAIRVGISNILAQYVEVGSSLPVASATPVAPTTSGGGLGAVGAAAGVLSINRQVGVISILATDRQHKEIKGYLDYVQKSHSSQVLIEAKILEVTLNDEYRSGIDWNFLNSNVTGTTTRSNFSDIGNLGVLADQVFSVGILPAELFGLDDTSLEASISLVESFGVSRTLSSPRLHAMNNQYAVLTFAENFVYFTLTVEEETQDNGGSSSSTLTIESEPHTVPVGVLLSLQPSIDFEKNEVVMNIRPTLSRITGFVDDPGVALQAAQLGTDLVSQIPIVDVRQLDSVLKIKSGQVMVIGGLMEERSVNKDRGIPTISKIPLIGNAFKSVQKVSDIIETVIFIKATIIPGSGVTVEDKDFYKKFSQDNKPFKF